MWFELKRYQLQISTEIYGTVGWGDSRVAAEETGPGGSTPFLYEQIRLN